MYNNTDKTAPWAIRRIGAGGERHRDDLRTASLRFRKGNQRKIKGKKTKENPRTSKDDQREIKTSFVAPLLIAVTGRQPLDTDTDTDTHTDIATTITLSHPLALPQRRIAAHASL